MKHSLEVISVFGKCESGRVNYCSDSFLIRQLYCSFNCKCL